LTQPEPKDIKDIKDIKDRVEVGFEGAMRRLW
jgi:hypothetical protein